MTAPFDASFPFPALRGSARRCDSGSKPIWGARDGLTRYRAPLRAQKGAALPSFSGAYTVAGTLMLSLPLEAIAKRRYAA